MDPFAGIAVTCMSDDKPRSRPGLSKTVAVDARAARSGVASTIRLSFLRNQAVRTIATPTVAV
jgi:hypothetical protein